MLETMRNENSGVSPKLREFGPIRVLDLMEVKRDLQTVVLSLESDTMAPERDTRGFHGVTPETWIPVAEADLRAFKRALGFTWGELHKLGLSETGYIRARFGHESIVFDGCVA